ncbi:MAG: ABC transporter substrate-binding protein [Gordonia sp. (in: high G+C Gram-positive bacteria)]
MRLRKYAAATLGLAVAASISLASCSSGPSGDSDSRTLKIGTATPFSSWDPTQASEGHLIPTYQAVYDTLLRKNADGTLAPWLATKWQYNADSTQLVLDLRNDVTFSDGTELDSDVVVKNLDAFRHGTGSSATSLANVSSVKANGPHSVQINLSVPDPALLNYLANAAGLIASGRAVGTHALASNPVGSGPYTLDTSSSSVDNKYVFVKRSGYWNPDVQKYDRIEINYLPDSTARLNALVSGQVDAAVLDVKSAGEAKKSGLKILDNPINWRGFVISDRAGTLVPALADVRVRQAINYAIDSPSILSKIYGNYGTVTSQIFGPDSTAYDKSLDNRYSYDPDKAKKLLAEAGYAKGFSLKFTYWANYTDAAEIPVLINQFANVGIKATAVSVPGDAQVADVFAGKFPLSLINLFQPNTFQNIGQSLLPDSTYNLLHTKDKNIAELTRRIQNGGDSAAVAPVARELNKYVVDQAWFAPWFRSSVLWGYNAKTVSVVNQAQQAAPSIYNYSPAG